MIYPLTCPNCQARLQVRADDPGEEFTCPRCLASVSPARDNASAIQSVPSLPPREFTGVRLPPLMRADADVERDRRITVGGILLLGLLGLAAVFLTVYTGRIANENTVDLEVLYPATLLAGGLFTVAAVAVFLRFSLRGWATRGTSAGQVVLSVLMTGAIIVTVPVALFVLFFFACVSGLNHH